MSFDVSYAAGENLPLDEVSGDEQKALAQAGGTASLELLDKLPAAIDRGFLEVRVCGHANAGYAHVDGIADTWVQVTVSERRAVPAEAPAAPAPVEATEGAPIVTATGESPEEQADQPGTPNVEAPA